MFWKSLRMMNIFARFVQLRLPEQETKHLFLFTIRSIHSSNIRFLENRKKSKSKISVLKRKINQDGNDVAIEWKYAVNVMKKLNLENKLLFGPLINSKPKTNDFGDLLATNRIIQHQTQIPILEPRIHYQHQASSPNDLDKILTFPLENKSLSSDLVDDLNFLRKHLEFLSKDSIPSVSTILQKTMPVERVQILEKWKQNMIKKLGEEGFKRYHQALLDNGSSLHNNISNFLSSTPESQLVIKEENVGHWNSLKEVLPNVGDVKLLEEFVTHPFLCYRGVVDCFAKYKDHLVVIDWKTSKKDKKNIKDVYDNPLQLAAYVGALNFDPNFQYLAQKGLIVVAYESGIPATLHFIDSISMKQYWIEWLKRVKQFWEMER